MNSQRIALLTDSGTNTPASFAAEHDIRIVPLRIAFADGTYDSGVDITAAQLAARLPLEVPKTSTPTPQTIRTILEQTRDDGYDRAVFVTISSGLSPTCQVVRSVASQMRDFSVMVVDSLSIGAAAGLVVMAAARMIDQDVPYTRMQRRLEDLVRRTDVFFSTTTMDYLWRGGRISEPVYRLGRMLDIKPVITCNDSGHYVVARKARGWDRSLQAQVSLVRDQAQGYRRVRLAVCCSDSCDCFDMLEDRLRQELATLGVEVEDVVRSDVSADLLVHTGPDLVGVGIQGIAY